MIVFLIKNDQPQIIKRHEDGASGAHDDPYLMISDQLILLIALLIIKL